MVASVLSQILVLFLIACVGLLVAKLGYLDDHTTNNLNKILLYVFVPCMIVSSATGGDAAYGDSTVVLMLVCAVGLYLLLPLLGLALNAVLRVPRERRNLTLLMTVCGNVGFMGYPVVQAFFGSQALFLNSIVTMFQSIPLYAGGPLLLSSARAEGSGRRATLSWRTLLSPALVASVLALALFFAGVQLPGFLADAVGSLGDVTSPLAMLLMGASLAGVDLKSLALDWRMHLYTLVKQLAVPLAFWFALAPVFPDRTVLGILTLVLAMPVATMTMVLAQRHGSDVQYATRAIVVTTLWSFVILPVLGFVIV